MDYSNLPKLPLSKPTPSAPDIPLHDIKPLVEIPDYSIYYFAGVVILAVALLLAALFFAWKFYKKRTDKSVRKAHYKSLENIDFSNPKAAAYAITKYGYSFKNDGARQSETYENLVARLAPFKYKKTVMQIDEETKGYYKIYLEIIDV